MVERIAFDACPRCATSSPCSRSGTRPAGPRTGTRSAWSAATRTTRCARSCSRSTRSPDGRRGDRGAGAAAGHAPPAAPPGVHGVAATTPKGRIVHGLVSGGCALYTAHTNADAPTDGVSESLALALGLRDVTPLEPAPAEPLDKVVVFVPVADADAVRRALAEAGAGRIGATTRPPSARRGRAGSARSTGPRPRSARSGSSRWSTRCGSRSSRARDDREPVVAAMLAAHPYEEPAYDVVELAPTDEPARGQGRIGTLAAPMTLREFAEHVAARAPGHRTRRAGRGRPRPAGAHRRAVRGSGRLPARPGATHRRGRLPDLRPAPPPGERVPGARGAARRPALVDVAHWAAEWTWLPVLRRKLAAALGDTVEIHVSTTPTDPWTFRVDTD